MQTSDIDNRFDFHPATTAAKRGDHGSVRNACAELAHLINHPSWKAGSKRLVTVAVSIALTLLVLVFYYAMTVDLVPSWPIMVLLALAIGQAAYTLLKSSATRVEAR